MKTKIINYKKLVNNNERLAACLQRLKEDEKRVKKTYNQIRLSKTYQLNNYIYKTINKILSKLPHIYNQNTKIVKTEISIKTKTKLVNELVSIVIPTRNGGNDFKKNLTSIINQKNILKMEILILDNNSTDGTREYAIKKGCRVYLIKENEFGHGKTRAFGANEALGKYLIFTVQDASITDEYTYSSLINFAKDYDLSAVSGCQKPKFDADSFAMWQNQYHYNVMNPNSNSIIYDASNINSAAYQRLNFLNKRKIICIDDVIACYKKEVFEKYNFPKDINFAEDAYIAQLILLDKKIIGLTYTSIVYHSHNIEPIYAFKRAYVDTISLKQIFNQNLNRFSGKSSLIKSQLLTIFILASTLCNSNKIPKSFSEMILQATHIKKDRTNPLTNALFELFPKVNLPKVKLNQKLIESLSRNSDPLIQQYSEFCTKINKNMFFEKLMANILGSYLAEIVLNDKTYRLKYKIESSLKQRV